MWVAGIEAVSMPDLTVEHLSEQRLLDAWPVLEMAAAEVIPSWWLHEAADLFRRGGGVLVVRGSDGIVHGLATYEPQAAGRRNRVLAIPRLVTFELSLKQPARHALLNALDLLAYALGCTEVALPLQAAGRHA